MSNVFLSAWAVMRATPQARQQTNASAARIAKLLLHPDQVGDWIISPPIISSLASASLWESSMSKNRLPYAILGLVGLAVGVLVAQQQPTPPSDTVVNPQANNPAAITAGRQIFEGTCSNCHGQGAVGDRQRNAPALNTTGLAYGDADADIFKT